MPSKLEYLKKYMATPAHMNSRPREGTHVKKETAKIRKQREALKAAHAKEMGKCLQTAPHNSDSDISPVRQAAPVRRQAAPVRHDSDGDISPVRQTAPVRRQAAPVRNDSDRDISPVRRTSSARMTSGQRAGLVSGADVKVETAETQQKQGGRLDGGPGKTTGKRAQTAHGRHDSDSDISPVRRTSPARMSSGLRAGLVAGTDLRKETADIRQRQREALEAAPAEATGKGAETVYRNRDGGRVTREEWLESKQKHRKKRPSEYPEQELEWGGGLKQQVNREEEQAELSRIAAQPFARYEPDEKYQEELRSKKDWHDPMKQDAAEDAAAQVRAARGPRQEKPVCPHMPWLNRFDIRPGYRWDGKIRTNGFETKLIEANNMKEYQRQEAWRRMDADDKD